MVKKNIFCISESMILIQSHTSIYIEKGKDIYAKFNDFALFFKYPPKLLLQHFDGTVTNEISFESFEIDNEKIIITNVNVLKLNNIKNIIVDL